MLTRLHGTRPGQGFPPLGRVPQCVRTKLGIEACNDRFALIVPDKRELGQTVPPIWCEFPIRATHFVSYRSCRIGQIIALKGATASTSRGKPFPITSERNLAVVNGGFLSAARILYRAASTLSGLC